MQAASYPSWPCCTCSVPGIARGDAVTVNGIAWKVDGLDPDAHNLTVLIWLRKA